MGFWGIPIAVDVKPTDPLDNELSTRQTVQQMIQIAKMASQTNQIASVLDVCLCSIGHTAPSKRDIARAIWYWVKQHVQFKTDEETVVQHLGYTNPNQELLISPNALLAMPTPQGDCDDFSMLIASLLLCAHIPCWFVTIAVDANEPDRWSHVYVKAWLWDEGRGMYLDASHGPIPGWETNRPIYKKMEWMVI